MTEHCDYPVGDCLVAKENQFDKLDGSDEHKHPKAFSERCYRRGVQQGLAMLDQFLHEEKNLKVDPASALDIAQSHARTMRFDGQFHRWYMHELIEKVEKGLL